jgi:hypothetical protein
LSTYCFQMLHKSCLKCFLHYLQCYMMKCKKSTTFERVVWQANLYFFMNASFKNNLQTQSLMAIGLLKWFPTNLFHVGKTPSSSSKYENNCQIKFFNISNIITRWHDCDYNNILKNRHSKCQSFLNEQLEMQD